METENKLFKDSEFSESAQETINGFADKMVDILKSTRASDWKQGWTNGKGAYLGMPQNLSGRNYSGTNSLFLSYDTTLNGYKTPVYMTFGQAMKEGLRIKKGAQAVPVLYWDLSIKDAKGKAMSRFDYNSLSSQKKSKCTVRRVMKSHMVYNIDQTNMSLTNYEKYNALLSRFQGPQIRDTHGMYVNEAMDRLIERQDWLCRIQTGKIVDGAFYSPSRDLVVCPMKEQFNIGKTPEETYRNGMEFYSSLLHEMTHSTGTANRLNREKGVQFGDAKYAKEEMVAELTAAMVGNAIGLDTGILQNNACYIQGWINAMRQEPKFILGIMADVSKASHVILQKIDEQRIALGQEPILSENKEKVADKSEDISQTTVLKKDVSMVLNANFNFLSLSKSDDGYYLQAVYDEKDLGRKKIKSIDGQRYELMPEGSGEKDIYLLNLASHVFAPEVQYLRDMRDDPINYNTAVVMKNQDDTYSVRVTVDGQSLEPRKVSNKDAYNFMVLNPSLKKDILLRDMVSKAYGDELKNLTKMEKKKSQGFKL